MSAAALGLLVDAYDWVIDWLRHLSGLSPLAPVLLKAELSEPLKVHHASDLLFELRRTFYAELRIEQDHNILFHGQPPREGRITVLPLSGALLRLHLTQESRYPTARHGITVTETVIAPLPNGPPIEAVDVVPSVVFPGPVACGWHAPFADRVRVTVTEDGKISEYDGPPSGQIMHHPARPGRMTLLLTAETAWGQTRIKRTVEVPAPELRVELLRPAVQVGEPGSKVTFEWRCYGAQRVALIAPGCDRPQRLDDTQSGLLEVTLGIEPAEFHLIARGYGGAETSVVLRTVPHLFASLPAE